ncbi:MULTISPECIES: aspartate/glutamate racemase family protein [unclassified Achromobacter]|uniref:aspartate/glutamate racemase family protein n=1 Tax=unclassified Achromobacter TaxID=2626865 RepID=UPI000B515C63|nr:MULTISPECIES: aspartate/glutamate racemase family protein [unclassified Achromobacter]OWT73772.1 hydantoin racemase [Achromobacter sp. HZ34]OWT79312.1 hydantoin racemase [Achromobacter sp. HZ28]
MPLGIIRVLTTSDQSVLLEHGRILEAEFGLKSVTRCIEDQPDGIYDLASETLAVPKIVRLGQRLQDEGCTALFLSCAADPGLAQLRAAVTVPVVSAGSAAARVAAYLNLPAAVIGIGDAAPAPFRRLLGEDVTYARPDGVTKTVDLLTPAGRAAALDCARRLHDAGAKVIVFSCTGLTTIGLAPRIRAEIGCAAVDAVTAAGMFAAEWTG